MTQPFANALQAHEPLTSSLWKCETCGTFVSLHSVRIITQATCPSCTAGSMKFCGTFDAILGVSSADA
jgi:rubrerythrin